MFCMQKNGVGFCQASGSWLTGTGRFISSFYSGHLKAPAALTLLTVPSTVGREQHEKAALPGTGNQGHTQEQSEVKEASLTREHPTDVSKVRRAGMVAITKSSHKSRSQISSWWVRNQIRKSSQQSTAMIQVRSRHSNKGILQDFFHHRSCRCRLLFLLNMDNLCSRGYYFLFYKMTLILLEDGYLMMLRTVISLQSSDCTLS